MNNSNVKEQQEKKKRYYYNKHGYNHSQPRIMPVGPVGAVSRPGQAQMEP
jgi:hypothetical protein